MGLIEMIMQQKMAGQPPRPPGPAPMTPGTTPPVNPQMMGPGPQKPQMTPPPMPQAERPGMLQRFGEGVQGFLGDDSRMAKLTMGLNSMRLSPDPNIARNAMVTMQTQQQQKQQAKRANRTAEVLEAAGQKEMAEAIRANPEQASALYAEYLKSKLRPQDERFAAVTGAQINERMPGADLDPTKMYNMSSTGKITQVGGSGTTVNVGGSTSPGIEALDKAYATDHLEWRRGGGSDMTRQLAQIGGVLEQIESGKELTGPMIGAMPDFVRSVMNPNAQDAKEQVEEVVQRNLRTVLGAQFTEKEGDRLISRAYNPSLPPETNARRLRALFTQMQTAAQQRQQMADYFDENGTLWEYKGPQPNINQFYDALDAVAPEARQGASGTGYGTMQPPPPGVNPELWKRQTPEWREEFIRAGQQGG